MGVLRSVALAILGISAFTFIALFGRLPVFRKTPVAWLHRLVWVYIPNGFAFLDSRLFEGRLVRIWNRSGSYILHENHPLVLIFFVGLLAIGECIFLPPAWPRISGAHQYWVPGVVALPYILLYKCVTTTSFITSGNHDAEMKRYPYDRVLFHPGNSCHTCGFSKPARSKHCKFCKACVSRHDHHCVWLMNCVGANNYVYFLLLLLSLSVMLIYGTFLGYTLLLQSLEQLVSPELQAAMKSWKMYFKVWGAVITAEPRIGTVALLMLMTAPLAVAFLAYHTYLIWAGTTTNETAKWSDWRDDVEDGFVYKARRSQIPDAPQFVDLGDRPWPVKSDQILVTDGIPPTEGYVLETSSNLVHYEEEPGPDRPIHTRWTQLHSMKDIDNIYDAGFWRNLRDAAGLSVRE